MIVRSMQDGRRACYGPPTGLSTSSLDTSHESRQLLGLSSARYDQATGSDIPGVFSPQVHILLCVRLSAESISRWASSNLPSRTDSTIARLFTFKYTMAHYRGSKWDTRLKGV